MDDKIMIARLEWLAEAPAGCSLPDWIQGDWAAAIGQIAKAALETITTQEEAIERLHEERQAQPVAWQWRYVGSQEWNTPSGGAQLDAATLKREVPIEQRPLYAAPTETWRPIDEAPIPDHEHVPTYWHYPCLIQNEAGGVFAGFARYARHDNNRNPAIPEKRILRWYEGTPVRFGVITKAKYFQPLPQPRKD